MSARSVRFDETELRIGAVGETEDAVADFESLDTFSEFGDGSCNVAPQDGGEVDGEALLGGAGTDLPVDRIDAYGMHTYEDLSARGSGIGEIFIDELGRWTIFVEHDCFHEGTSAELRCGRAGGWPEEGAFHVQRMSTYTSRTTCGERNSVLSYEGRYMASKKSAPKKTAKKTQKKPAKKALKKSAIKVVVKNKKAAPAKKAAYRSLFETKPATKRKANGGTEDPGPSFTRRER